MHIFYSSILFGLVISSLLATSLGNFDVIAGYEFTINPCFLNPTDKQDVLEFQKDATEVLARSLTSGHKFEDTVALAVLITKPPTRERLVVPAKKIINGHEGFFLRAFVPTWACGKPTSTLPLDNTRVSFLAVIFGLPNIDGSVLEPGGDLVCSTEYIGNVARFKRGFSQEHDSQMLILSLPNPTRMVYVAKEVSHPTPGFASVKNKKHKEGGDTLEFMELDEVSWDRLGPSRPSDFTQNEVADLTTELIQEHIRMYPPQPLNSKPVHNQAVDGNNMDSRLSRFSTSQFDSQRRRLNRNHNRRYSRVYSKTPWDADIREKSREDPYNNLWPDDEANNHLPDAEEGPSPHDEMDLGSDKNSASQISPARPPGSRGQSRHSRQSRQRDRMNSLLARPSTSPRKEMNAPRVYSLREDPLSYSIKHSSEA